MANSTAVWLWRFLGRQSVRQVLTALAVLVPATALFSSFIAGQVNELLTTRTVDALQNELQSFRIALDHGGINALTATVAARSNIPGKGLYRLEFPDPASPPIGNLQVAPESVSTAGNVFKVWDVADMRFHTVAGLSVALPAGGRLLVARDVEDQRDFADNLQRTAFAGIGALTLIALGLGWAGNRRSGRRVEVVAATARSIMAGDFTRRLPSDGTDDEFDHLTSSLNAMLSRIEDLMQALREVSDNIAHDLKTPLTRLRNRAEAALRDNSPAAHRNGLDQVIEEADGLIQTFNALLLVARLEAGAVDATKTICNITELVRDVADLYQPVADDAGLHIAIVGTVSVPLACNRQLVVQAIANMLDNAVKYSADTPNAVVGPITVSVATLINNDVEVTVADRGPGIAAADRERATKRFVRLEQSRSRPGTGLGLSLVAAVARLHGGSVRLEDNMPGLRIVLVLRDSDGGHMLQPTPKGAIRRVSQPAPLAR